MISTRESLDKIHAIIDEWDAMFENKGHPTAIDDLMIFNKIEAELQAAHSTAPDIRKDKPCQRCHWYPPSRPKEMDDEDKKATCYPCLWSDIHVDNFRRARTERPAQQTTSPMPVHSAGENK